MGVMLDGKYLVDDPAPDTDAGGAFKRRRSTIRGEIGTADHPPVAGRYHLYVAWNCPWAHRALITAALLDLGKVLSFSFARPRRTDQGWVYDSEGAYRDPLLGVTALHEVYARGAEAYSGRVTVPVLWDKVTATIVNNESAMVVRMLDREFGTGRLYPPPLAAAIDGWNARIYPGLNNGVYRAGFAGTQAAYDTAAHEVFATLDAIEAQLARTRYLTGDTLTEADVRLFPTLARFDVAYHGAFKCNRRRIVDCPNLWAYARDLYQTQGISGTVDFDVYRRGYYSPSARRNPHGIVPVGPRLDWWEPHGRD
jgi:putative glutathione S-transferase